MGFMYWVLDKPNTYKYRPTSLGRVLVEILPVALVGSGRALVGWMVGKTNGKRGGREEERKEGMKVGGKEERKERLCFM